MKTLQILLVEDSPGDARLLREALREAPYEVAVEVAQDGDEALNYLNRAIEAAAPYPDLILLDLNLPRKSGHEVLAEIKADGRLKQIPILIMSSSRATDDVKAAYNLNANCYIAKPMDLGEYLDVVKAIEEFWFSTATLPEVTELRRTRLSAGRTSGARGEGLHSAPANKRAGE